MSDLLIRGMKLPKTGRYFVTVDNTDGKDKIAISVMSEFERGDKTRPLLAVHEAFPAADVVEVVRCKDCMYCQKDELGRWCFNDYENELRDDDFCSHGKRKESKT